MTIPAQFAEQAHFQVRVHRTPETWVVEASEQDGMGVAKVVGPRQAGLDAALAMLVPYIALAAECEPDLEARASGMAAP